MVTQKNYNSLLLKDLKKIVELTSKEPKSLEWLVERMSVTSEDIRFAIEQSASFGYKIRLNSDMVSSKVVAVEIASNEISVGSMIPGRKRIALVTDMHFGSRHCHKEGMLLFLNHAKKMGVETVVCSGDILDGNKHVLLHDQQYFGWDDQVKDLQETLKKAPKFNWIAIDGNHDGYFSNSSGMVSGKGLEAKMREIGINWTFSGVCVGRAVVSGAKIGLWHPHGGASSRNAVNRILTERIESSQEFMNVLVMGHFHKFSVFHVYPQNVLGVAGGTFQRKQSEFSNRISKPWDIGGTIISFNLHEDGRTSEYSAEFFETP